VLFNELPVVVNLAVANEVAAQHLKGLVAAGGQAVDGEAVEPDATLAGHNEFAVVRTAMRDFSKIGLQGLQNGHWNPLLGGADGFVIKNAAHGNNKIDDK
jgi:hypothetical protein